MAFPQLAPRSSCLASGRLPERLSDSGCYADLTGKRFAADLVPYEVAAPLWTDGARKRRAFAIPPHTTVGLDAEGMLVFPIGSAIVKEFSFHFAADGGRAIETRLMLRTPDGWSFATYLWNPSGDDALRLYERRTLALAVVEDQRTVAIDYVVPDEPLCRTCHSPGSPGILGLSLAQLDREAIYTVGRRNQLRVLWEAGVFGTAPLPEPDPATRLVDYRDPRLPLDRRARSYLHAQCGHCHRPEGYAPIGMTMDLRGTVTLSQMHVCRENTQFLDILPRIAPGKPERSALWQRLATTDPHRRMPLVGWTRRDPHAQVIRDWIAAMRSLSCHL